MDPTHTTGSSRPEAAATRPEDIQSPYNVVLLAELTQKLGSVEKAKEVYALFSASIQTAATTPPPPTIPTDSKIHTAVAPDGSPQDLTGVPDSGFQQVETVPSANSPEAEEDAATEKLEVDGKPEDNPEIVEPEGREAGNPNSEGEKKGETPSVYIEGGTPFKFAEGDTPDLVVEGETPVLNEFAKGETPVEAGEETPDDFRGATPESIDEGETPEDARVPGPVREGLQFIVDLVDDQEEEEKLTDERTERRRARRSLIDEVDDLVHTDKDEFPDRGIASGEVEESRLAKERIRKGKHAAATQSRRSRKTPSVKEVEESLPLTKVPFAKGSSGSFPESESEPEDQEESEEELNYERTEVWVTRGLLDAMRRFDDQKRAATYKERSSAGKMAKSGKQYDPKELQEIESDEEFRTSISAIGFEWLLKHSTTEVPVDLAREFFSTFRLKNTTDVDADSITFRLFNEEYEMSIREWSLRMGLFSRADDEEGIWNERMVGAPKHTPGFKVGAAWEFLTHANAGVFKSSYSKASHIADRILRFAQTFISYNLMGTANSALTTTDLYFTWCMAKSIKVHLGYWLAQACHQMTGNPSRHMYTCHLLGAYLQRNVIMKIAKSAPEVLLCEPPETFSVEYFFNKGLLQMNGKDVFFYDMGDKAKVEPEGMDAGPSEDVEDLRKEMQTMKTEMTKELGGLRKELGGAREEIQALRGDVADLTLKVSRNNERMAEAVDLMMKMSKWVERSLSLTQLKNAPGSSGGVKQPDQGSSPINRPPLPLKTVVPPSTSRPLINPAASKPLLVRKPVSKQQEIEEDEPESPARKKVKVNQPRIPPQSGSRRGRTQK